MNPDAGAGSQPDPQDDKLRRALRGSEQGDQGDNEGKEGQGGKEGKEGLRGKDGKEAGKPSRLRPRGAPAKPSEDAPAPTQSAAPAPPAGGAAVPEAAFAAAATAPPAADASAPRADAPDAAGPNAAGPLFDRPVGRTDSQSKEFLQAVKRQQKLRRQQDLEEARRLQDQAKQMMQKTKQKERTASQLQKHEDWVTRVAAELGFDPDRPITEVPPVPTGMEEVEFHTMRTGRAFVRLLYDNATNSYMYEVIEPKLNNTEMEVFHFLRETLIRTLDGRQGRDPNTDWDEILLNAIQQAILDHSVLVDQVSTQRIQYHLVRDFLGYGPIDTMMQDPMLEDLSCDGPGIPIYVFHRKYESIRSTVTFPDEETLDSFVIRLAQRSGKHISIAEPILDATLPDGSRLQTTLSREVTTRGSSFTIRKFRADPFTPPDLVGYNTMDSRMAAYMWLVVENGSSMIMAGGTASGKTTTLNATCQFVPPEKKIVSIEDTREINLNHENWIAGVTRAGFGGQIVGGKPAGAIDMYKLLEAALRQRPEYLLVGEVRGPEALTLFQAMATGHTVYSTMHADSVASAVYRLENPPINVPRLMLQTLDIVVIQGQVKVRGRMSRRVLEITEIVGFDPDTGELLTNAVFRYDPTQDQHEYLGKSQILDVVMEKRSISAAELEKEWQNRMFVLDWMREHNVRDYKQVSAIITEYYQRPQRVIERLSRADEEGVPAEKVVEAITVAQKTSTEV